MNRPLPSFPPNLLSLTNCNASIKKMRDSIVGYISSSPEGLVKRLYGEGSHSSDSIWACKAIFLALSAISKQVVMRMIFIEEPLQHKYVSSWFQKSHEGLIDSSLGELSGLRILEACEDRSDRCYKLNAAFRTNLQKTISEPSMPWATSESMKLLKPDKRPPAVAEIEKRANEMWDDVLRLLVGLPLLHQSSTSAASGRSQSSVAENFLRRSGLLAIIRDDSTGHNVSSITEKGYCFMLSSRVRQVWTYVFATLSQTSDANLVEALTLLFMLASCESGVSYPIEALTKLQQQLVFEFSQLGLIFMKSISSSRFYPSKLIIELLMHGKPPSGKRIDFKEVAGASAYSDVPVLEADELANLLSHGNMYIVVETNNQVVAYLNSDLQLAMLELFVEVAIRLPNVVLGRLTRERVRKAYRLGITSSQILEFLVAHCHPIVKNNRFIVPENISDQLKLWEAESSRIHSADGVLFNLGQLTALTLTQFKEIVAYLKHMNSLLWSSEDSRIVVVTPIGADQLQVFIEDTFGMLS